MTERRSKSAFPSAGEDAATAEITEIAKSTPQTRSPSYQLAFTDQDFLLREELRPVRLQLELLKPEMLLQEEKIVSTVVVFGSARIPDPDTARARLAKAEAALERHPGDPVHRKRAEAARRTLDRSHYYEEARAFARRISEAGQAPNARRYVVVTGGGPGIMEAANRGAHDVGAESIGLNIVLPAEQGPNPYITPKLCFQFHYFAIRKMHFLMRAKALTCFPGGFGTLDELFETLTLIQTGKIERIPVLLFGESYWRRIIDFEAMVEENVIAPDDLSIFRYVETAEEAWNAITEFYEGLKGTT
ncbi:TIGR00730 family Rossman fold protein [Rhodospirillaceae bacterium SYSU D60014]|uniref:LOG family protein n=1 Tax=Virgifigura deserti TaxID=2268457 RepID=UPI000E66E003